MKKIVLVFISYLITLDSFAANEKFDTGPVFNDYGKHASVIQDMPVSKEIQLKVVFDVAGAAKPGEINRQFDSLARFINMHVANGVLLKNINLALVVHGRAGVDLIKNSHYQALFSKQSTNVDLLEQLLAKQTQVYLCGQSAAYYDISNDMLVPGVKMALSAMTAHALLQQQGYTLNPF